MVAAVVIPGRLCSSIRSDISVSQSMYDPSFVEYPYLSLLYLQLLYLPYILHPTAVSDD